jgi:hypothetical protein
MKIIAQNKCISLPLNDVIISQILLKSINKFMDLFMLSGSLGNSSLGQLAFGALNIGSSMPVITLNPAPADVQTQTAYTTTSATITGTTVSGDVNAFSCKPW